MEAARCELAAGFIADLRGAGDRIRETRAKLTAAVQPAGTSLTGLFGAGPVTAAAVIGGVRAVARFPGRATSPPATAAAPIEVSSGGRTACRLSRRGNRRLNHAIHLAAVTQISHRRSGGRACCGKKLAGGKTRKEALRALKRQISDAIFGCLQAGARRAGGPGGQPGDGSIASAAGFHPEYRLFGQAAPGPGHHPAAAAGIRGRAGHSPAAALPPPATPQVQVERPQPSEDERPAGAAGRRPHAATGKATRPSSTIKPQRPKATPRAPKKTGEPS